MQDAPTAPELTAPELTATDRTAQVTRGVGRLLRAMGYGVVTEFGLRTGRRVDLFGLAADGRMVAVEVKTSVADFRGDAQWPEYLDWCDAFYFAEIGRASCRERVCQYVSISVVALSLIKQTTNTNNSKQT